jgi:hypothetical protein
MQFPKSHEVTLQWPPHSICEVIDVTNSDVINRNFGTALFLTKRGSSSKSMFEGGNGNETSQNSFMCVMIKL